MLGGRMKKSLGPVARGKKPETPSKSEEKESLPKKHGRVKKSEPPSKSEENLRKKVKKKAETPANPDESIPKKNAKKKTEDESEDSPRKKPDRPHIKKASAETMNKKRPASQDLIKRPSKDVIKRPSKDVLRQKPSMEAIKSPRKGKGTEKGKRKKKPEGQKKRLPSERETDCSEPVSQGHSGGLGGGWDENALEAQPWYFGTWPREKLTGLLKTEGAFLCRLSQDVGGDSALVVAVYSGGSVVHTPVCVKGTGPNRRFAFDDREQESVLHLVKTYVKERIPLNKGTEIYLEKGVKRPDFCIRHRDLEEKEVMGTGPNGGELLQGIFKGLLGKKSPCVLKKLHAESEDSQLGRLVAEAKTMDHLHHPKPFPLIALLYGLAGDRFPMMLAVEAWGRPLDEELRASASEGVPPPDPAKLRLIAQLTETLDFLCSKNTLHRDLRASHFRWTTPGKLKLADFSFAVKGPGWRHEEGPEAAFVPSRALRWSSPEVVTCKDFTFASDVWATAVTAWEIWRNGETPFGSASEKEVEEAVRAGQSLHLAADPSAQPAPDSLEEKLERLLAKAWTMLPTLRPSPAQFHELLTTLLSSLPSQNLFLHKGQLDHLT